MRVVIKLGGTLLDDPASRSSLAAQLAEVRASHDLAVVHGGGRQLTRHLEERGVESRFVNGLRVSDEHIVDAVTEVIAGGVNKQLVGAINATGTLAVGLSGIDGMLTTAHRLSPDLGFVGQPDRTDPRLLDALIAAGYLPVVACVAGDAEGHAYNVNADQMAVSCAAGFHAATLIFLTDVPGVMASDGVVIPRLTPGDCLSLIASGAAKGGMQAKLEASMAALSAGLDEVVIAPGREPEICQRLLGGEAIGTRVAAGAAS
jgi:acetylglutamate kinase